MTRKTKNETSFTQERDPNLEYCDPTPVHIPGKTDQQAPLTLREEMQRFIRQEISKQAEQNQLETFEEADDFDVEDEDEDLLLTEYTVVDMRPIEGSDTLDGQSEDSSPPAEQPSASGPSETDAAPPEGDHAVPQVANSTPT